MIRRPCLPLLALLLGFLLPLSAEGAVAVKEVRPARGPVGSPVAIVGTDLQEVTSVTIGGTAASFTRKEGYLLATVPEGAQTGSIRLAAPGGAVEALARFEVGQVPAVSYRIVAALISQGVTDLTARIPLVAGRKGILRVVLQADRSNALQPAVRVTLRDKDGREILKQSIPAFGPGVPQHPDPGSLWDSWNLPIPAALIQPGLTLHAEILPDSSGARVRGRHFPADRRPLALDVVPLEPLRITFIPLAIKHIDHGSLVSVPPRFLTSRRTLADWLAPLRAMFPVAEVQAEVEPLWVMEDQVLAAKDEVESLQNMVCKLERRRQDAGEGAFLRYYVGVYAAPADARFNGYAPIALPGINVGKSVVVRDAEAEGELEVDGPVVLLHELGHAMGRDHVLCDHEPEPHDEDFPFKGGSIGSWGVDLDRVQLKDPARVHDIMSYCLPAWVSDFTYRHILEALADDSDSVRRRRARSSALVVSGTIGPAGPSLEPVLTVSTSTAAPAAGPDTVVLRDAGGAAIRSLTFSPEVAAEGAAPSGERSFLFDIPISPKEEEALASLEVITPQGETKVLRAAPSAGAQDRPAAVALPHGQVLLVWDQTLHPEVTARDPRNGAILGTGSKGELHLATDAGQLELELLDGLKTMRLQVPVQRRP